MSANDYPDPDKLPDREGYYRKLRSTVKQWISKGVEEPYAQYLLAAPDLFYTLVQLEFDPDVDRSLKLKIGAAVAYFISPLDVVPDWIFGPVGLVDDVLLAAKTLDHVMNEAGAEAVEEHWPGDESALKTIRSLTDLGAHWTDSSWAQSGWKILKEHWNDES